MLRLVGEQVESLFDELLPIGVRELPEDLARLDLLLSDSGLLSRSLGGGRRRRVVGVVRRSRCLCLCG